MFAASKFSPECCIELLEDKVLIGTGHKWLTINKGAGRKRFPVFKEPKQRPVA